MEVKWSEKAKKDLQKLEKAKQNFIITFSNQKLNSRPLNTPEVSLVERENLQIFRLKAMNGEVNHRIFFDIEDSDVKIYAVLERDLAYTESSIDKLRKRKQDR